MPRAKKRPTSFGNINELLRSMALPTEVSDAQLKQMLIQLMIDYPEEKRPDSKYLLLKNKISIIELIHKMNHVKDGDDALSAALLAQLGPKVPQGN